MYSTYKFNTKNIPFWFFSILGGWNPPSFGAPKERCQKGQMAKWPKNIPSREWIHIPPWEKENHRLKMPFLGGYVSSLEGRSPSIPPFPTWKKPPDCLSLVCARAVRDALFSADWKASKKTAPDFVSGKISKKMGCNWEPPPSGWMQIPGFLHWLRLVPE